jgi:hypothetical protein
MGRACGMHEEKRNACMVLVRKPEGKRSQGRRRRRREDNIKINLRKIQCSFMDWINMAQDMDQWRLL